MKTFVLSFVFIATQMPAWATSYAPPERQVIQSPDGRFELIVDPKSKIHSVRSTKTRKTLWDFKRTVWHDSWFVSPDGRRVVVVRWRFCKTDELDAPAVEIYHQGRLERTFSYRTISKPRRLRFNEVGPIGSFWRVWRADTWQKGSRVYIETAGRGVRQIDTTDGKLINRA